MEVLFFVDTGVVNHAPASDQQSHETYKELHKTYKEARQTLVILSFSLVSLFLNEQLL